MTGPADPAAPQPPKPSSPMMMSAAQTIMLAPCADVMARREHRSIDERRLHNGRGAIRQLSAPGCTDPPVYNLSGLALSGGGVRSATFCLGALQALDEAIGIARIDLMSTVSGGGYIGCAVTAGMANGGGFPFATPDDCSDPRPVGHLRNYSNYLFPRGARLEWPRSLAVVLRGLITNLVLVAMVVLAMTAATIWAYPDRAMLLQGSFLLRLLHLAIWPAPFALTVRLLGVFCIYLLAWAALRSFRARAGSDVRGPAISIGAYLLLTLVVAAATDLQPLLLARLLDLRDRLLHDGGVVGAIRHTKLVLAGLGTFGSVIAAFASRMSAFLQATERRRGGGTVAARLVTKGALVLAGLVVPLVIWGIYLHLCMQALRAPHPFGVAERYAIIAAAIAIFALLVAPNANSLHRLYRDRLSKAFLFDPTPPATIGGDFKPLDGIRLNQCGTPTGGPYPLVNAALNIQASRRSNRLGRNADFFVFSPHHVGSDSTGYANTARMQRADPNLNLGTAMAISGAAASADMGSKTVRLLAPTLALLNIRLGYWMRNPALAREKRNLRAWLRDKLDPYLLAEMFGLLTEKHRLVYLTDGGHIENLGLYQLLKRGCSFIVVVDAEADEDYGFGALITLERFARIDLGIRISLPWPQIAAAAKAVDAGVAAGQPVGHNAGPHGALGVIQYPGGQTGHLLYLKASMTGDEKDYVLDYKRRNPSFPHETTSDQFFSEEQFEAYRALGFHAMASVIAPDSSAPVAFDGARSGSSARDELAAAIQRVG